LAFFNKGWTGEAGRQHLLQQRGHCAQRSLLLLLLLLLLLCSALPAAAAAAVV